MGRLVDDIRYEPGRESLVARFEECIYIPESGPARILSHGPSIPLTVTT